MNMANMAYCRFDNTARDLRECEGSLFDDYLSEDEKRARLRLVKTCKRIVSDWESNNGELPA